MGFTRHERPTPIDANPLRSQEGLPVSIVSKACFFVCFISQPRQPNRQTSMSPEISSGKVFPRGLA